MVASLRGASQERGPGARASALHPGQIQRRRGRRRRPAAAAGPPPAAPGRQAPPLLPRHGRAAGAAAHGRPGGPGQRPLRAPRPPGARRRRSTRAARLAVEAQGPRRARRRRPAGLHHAAGSRRRGRRRGGARREGAGRARRGGAGRRAAGAAVQPARGVDRRVRVRSPGAARCARASACPWPSRSTCRQSLHGDAARRQGVTSRHQARSRLWRLRAWPVSSSSCCISLRQVALGRAGSSSVFTQSCVAGVQVCTWTRSCCARACATASRRSRGRAPAGGRAWARPRAPTWRCWCAACPCSRRHRCARIELLKQIATGFPVWLTC